MKLRLWQLILSLFICGSASAQQPTEDKKFAFSTVTSSNIEDALRMLDVYLYNINVPNPNQKKCSFNIYLEEFGKDSLIRQQKLGWGETLNPSSSESSHTLLGITFHNKTDSSFFVRLKTSTGERGVNMIKDKQYNLPHDFRPFKTQDMVPGKKIPVLLYGSMWHDEDLPKGAVRFCMEKRMDTDFSSEAFNKMPHYYILSIELQELK